MPKHKGLSRREFMRASAAGATGAAIAAVACRRRSRPAAAHPPAPSAPDPGVPRYFPAAEFVTLAAACERILPADVDPGARDLGVADYLDRTFSSPDRPVWHLIVRRGLTRLDREARKRFGRPFASAAPADQDRLLGEFQQREGKDRIFFAHLLAATLEGAFCDPSYGGNREERGWRLAGFVRDPCGLPPATATAR
jgi:gluconate 2-dehydrogenase gamma chain